MSEPTHTVHWRASADARIVGSHFGFLRTHEAKIRQAQACYNGGLISDRCHFGPRRVILEGELEYTPPRYGRDKPSGYGYDIARLVMLWTLKMLYGMPCEGFIDQMPDPENLRIEVRVRPVAAVA